MNVSKFEKLSIGIVMTPHQTSAVIITRFPDVHNWRLATVVLCRAPTAVKLGLAGKIRRLVTYHCTIRGMRCHVFWGGFSLRLPSPA